MPSFLPLIREVRCPSSALDAFSAIASEPGAVLLESSGGGVRLGRYSFVACRPFLIFRSKGTRVEVQCGGRTEVREGDPFALLNDLMADSRVARPPEAPPLIAGAVGYFSYDLGRLIERIPEETVDDVPVADCHLGFYGAVAAVDHVEGRAWVCGIGAPETDPRAEKRLAERRVAELAERLLAADPAERVGTERSRGQAPSGRGQGRPALPVLPLESNFRHDDYVRAIARAKEYIGAGDIYQVNLSQRLSAPLASTPFDLYRRLRSSNPAPFAAYFETPEAAVVCCSPERFLQVRGPEVETRPIKGTRPRGATEEEDARLAAELLASEKDRAENVMIVDLERNDIGRVCEFGTVHVPELFALESYATVHHLVSTVRGRLRSESTAVDCLRACFPGGSITGAPKVRSMEIIEELEPTRRGIYTGAIGYLCFSGDMDVNIVIRTLVVKDGVAYFQVGGGIVADSDPEAEYLETVDKARALAAALAAEAGAEGVAWPG
jgi:para-aminobenzoate synthetase component 1